MKLGLNLRGEAASNLKYEFKICLSNYKIPFGVFFVVMLSLIRGVAYSFEIGVAMEPPMAILAAVFCADTYTREIISGRSQVQRLYPMKKRMGSIAERMMIQEIFLTLLAVMGYGLFFLFQRPRISAMGQDGLRSEAVQFLLYFAAMVITVSFWGILSNLLSCVMRNMWMGIGACVILWVITNSGVIGDRYFGVWNIFSYTFRDVENSGDFSWICGKLVCTCAGIAAMAVLPQVIEKRGC